MIARWRVSILIFSLTLLGVVSQQQVSVPNQEIVLQFEDVNLTSKVVQHTIEGIKKQLRDVGGSHIQVKKLEDGKLRISYFSQADVSSVKKAFSSDYNVAFSHTSSTNKENKTSNYPLEKPLVAYNLDIYEIQPNHNTSWDFNGIVVLKPDTKSDRFLDPNSSLSVAVFKTIHINGVYKTSYKVCKNIALTFSENLHTIPEVRAGPFLS